MKFAWGHLMVIGGLMLAATLAVGCEEKLIEPFPNMTPPAEGKGGIRGHMHGGPTKAALCSEEWNIGGELLPAVSCPGSESTASVDASENDLFFFDELEPGDYWLLGKGELFPSWYLIGEHGHRVTVKEGEWTDVATFEVEGS
jgi:hypothetical protein